MYIYFFTQINDLKKRRSSNPAATVRKTRLITHFVCPRIDLCQPAVRPVRLDDPGVRGPVDFRRGQRHPPHLVAALLRRCLRRPDAGDLDDDTDLENDTHSGCDLHGKSCALPGSYVIWLV